ncbi:MAG: histidinol dehydrogenase [Verrucomicrobiales bacterium]
MQRILTTDTNFSEQILLLDRRYLPRPEVQSTVAEILQSLEQTGDQALLDWTTKFGGPELQADQLRIDPERCKAAWKSLPEKQKDALRYAHQNIQQFAEASLRKSWSQKNAEGAKVGERYTAFDRVGIYVPGGSAPLVSTALMTVTLAAVAQVPQIVVCTPSHAEQPLNPALLAALHLAGAHQVFQIGGAQAIAAMAVGTATIPAVQKIFGPGNAYVMEAKRQVFGRVAVDLLPGPSEIMIIADGQAEPDWVAADMVAQAEHGADSIAVVVSPSGKLLDNVERAIEKQLQSRQRTQQLQGSLNNASLLVQTQTLEEAFEIANQFAPEHLSLAVQKPKAAISSITTAGAIFVGGISPVAAGDYLAGPSHELPTGGAGKSFAGLTVDQFQRRTSIVEYTPAALKKIRSHITTLCELEGLDGHAYSVSTRI